MRATMIILLMLTTLLACERGAVDDDAGPDGGGHHDGAAPSPDEDGGEPAGSCPNGLREGDEACDDGNAVAGDGCDPTCAVEEGSLCYELGGPSLCLEAGCGDGCVFGDLGSACPAPSRDIAQEECDDANTVSGDGCSATCDVEEGFNCSAAQPPSRCWPEPRYAVSAASARIEETYPGMRRTGYHEVHLSITERLRFTVVVDAFGVGTHPADLHPDRPVEVQPELLRIFPDRNVVVSLSDGSATLEAGEHTLRLRSGADRVGEYSYRLTFAAP